MGFVLGSADFVEEAVVGFVEEFEFFRLDPLIFESGACIKPHPLTAWRLRIQAK
jgi:hypothetical protein